MSAFGLNHFGPGDVQPLQRFFELPPIETALLPASAVEPFKGTLDREAEEAAKGLFVAAHAVVVVVPDQFSVQSLDELAPRLVALGFDPLFHSSFGSLQLFACRPFHHP